MATDDTVRVGRGILDGVFATELEAAWFAANRFYAPTERSRVEYGGHIFVRPDGKYVLTAFRSKSDDAIAIPRESFQGLAFTPLWRTHPPAANAVTQQVEFMFGIEQYFFSADDKRPLKAC